MGSGASNLFTQNPMKKNFPIEDVPTFKIVLVGDSNVGKTSIFLRYTREQFDYSYQPTMNVNIGNVTKKVQFPFETIVSVSLWDLPGREEIDLRRNYYKDIDAAIVVVDLSDEGSLEMAGTWKQDINNNSVVSVTDNKGSEKTRRKSVASQAQIPILLIGNKLDKVSSTTDEDTMDEDFVENTENDKVIALEEIALQHSFVGSVAVSACDCDGGVHAAFRSLLRFLLQKKAPKKSKERGGGGENREGSGNHLISIFSDPNQHGAFTRNMGSVDDHVYEPLKITRVPEADEIIGAADRNVRAVEFASVGLLVATKNFKKACCVSGITDNNKSSMEECITCLKDTLANGKDEDVLIGVEEAGYIKLSVANDDEAPGTIKRVLTIYDKEVCKKTRKVLAQCPVLKIQLSDQLKVLEEVAENLVEKASSVGLNKKQIRLAVQNLNENIEKIKDTIALSDESMRITDEQFKKIKNAMMW